MMRRVFGVLMVVILLVGLYLVAWPVRVDPVAWTPPAAPPLTGVYAPNTALAAVERLPVGGVGPEAVLVGPNGRIYTGLEDGRIMRMDEDGASLEEFVNTGGRPQSMEFDAAGNLIVCDTDRGLLSIGPDGSVTVLATEADDLPFHFTNDLDIASYGTIYFTDASWKFGTGEAVQDILEHRGNGRLLAYSPARKQTQVLLSGLQFANGVALAPDESYVLVNETGAFRTRRVWLTGPKAGSVDIFIENLPGYPDNITSNGIDTFWLALASPRQPAMENRLGPNPFLTKLVMRLPERFRPDAVMHGFVLGLDLDGRVIHNLQDASPGCYGYTTSAAEYDRMLYIGSLVETAIARLPVPQPRLPPPPASSSEAIAPPPPTAVTPPPKPVAEAEATEAEPGDSADVETEAIGPQEIDEAVPESAPPTASPPPQATGPDVIDLYTEDILPEPDEPEEPPPPTPPAPIEGPLEPEDEPEDDGDETPPPDSPEEPDDPAI